MNNLAIKSFKVLRNLFFDAEGNPVLFKLREKRNTQDDPFDEFIATNLDELLQDKGARCQRSTGPLISPDMVVISMGMDVTNEEINNNPEEIIGIEVKKLERGTNGKIARPTGMDYNSTPPCGRVKIYTSEDKPLTIKGYYLFACLENDESGNSFVSAMCLCDGSILNDDYELYLQITGSREKGINMGTYGDGANRNRPMLIFSNPLGADFLDHKMTLISEVDFGEKTDGLELVWRLMRKDVEDIEHTFYAYMDGRDSNYENVQNVSEPFPTPQNRVSGTQGRGKFRLLKYYEELYKLCQKNTEK